jgi:hypothetical protein
MAELIAEQFLILQRVEIHVELRLSDWSHGDHLVIQWKPQKSHTFEKGPNHPWSEGTKDSL